MGQIYRIGTYDLSPRTALHNFKTDCSESSKQGNRVVVQFRRRKSECRSRKSQDDRGKSPVMIDRAMRRSTVSITIEVR